MGYSSTTKAFNSIAEEWKADCPRCRNPVGPANVPCPNCEQPNVMYVLETHSQGPNLHETFWTETYLECGTCHSKLKTFPCPQDCGGVVTMPCISAFISLPRRWLKSFRHAVKLGFLIAAFAAWAYFYTDPKIDRDKKKHDEANMAFFIGAPTAFVASLIVGRMVRPCGPKKWRKFKE